MKVTNMKSASGKPVANQFIITDHDDMYDYRVFQSYDSVIVKQAVKLDGSKDTLLDRTYWDYSTTTGKYRNQFLGEERSVTLDKIKSGEYVLVDLN